MHSGQQYTTDRSNIRTEVCVNDAVFCVRHVSHRNAICNGWWHIHWLRNVPLTCHSIESTQWQVYSPTWNSHKINQKTDMLGGHNPVACSRFRPASVWRVFCCFHHATCVIFEVLVSQAIAARYWKYDKNCHIRSFKNLILFVTEKKNLQIGNNLNELT